MFLPYFTILITVTTKNVLLSIKIGVIYNRVWLYQPVPCFVSNLLHKSCTSSVMANTKSPPLGSFIVSAQIPKCSLSPSSNNPSELPVSNQDQNEDKQVSTDVGFQKVIGINLDTVCEVPKVEKETLAKSVGQKRKDGDEIIDEDIKSDNSNVMMKFVATGLPATFELRKKNTILPPSLLHGVTEFVRKTIVTDACKKEPTGLIKDLGKHLIRTIKADVTCELTTSHDVQNCISTENIEIESHKLLKDTSLVKLGNKNIKNVCVDSQSSEEIKRLKGMNTGNISLSSIHPCNEVPLIQNVPVQHNLMSCCKGETDITSVFNHSMSQEIQGLQGMELAAEGLQSSVSLENDKEGFKVQHDRFATDVEKLSTEKRKCSLGEMGTDLFEDIGVHNLEKEPSLITKKVSSKIITTEKMSSLIKTKEKKLGDLKDAFDISVLFSENFDKEFKKYKQQAKKTVKEKARKQNRHDIHSSIIQSEEGEGENSGKVTKKKKPVPNYFIAIQITNPVIHEALRKVQKRVVEQNKDLLPALNPIPSLHLTVFVMYLASNEDIQRAKDALDECCKELKGQYMHKPLIIDIHGVGHFRNEVVFAKVSPEENVQKLQKIADVVEMHFEAHAISSIDKKGFKPHITIMKLSRAPKLRKKGIKKIESCLFQEFANSYFGLQEVSRLQLCAMMKPKSKSGYYQVEHELIFAETTRASADDELYKMSCTIVQSCINAALYRLEQENLTSEMPHGEVVVSHLDKKSKLSKDKDMNLYYNEPDAKCAEKEETRLVHDDKPKASHNE